MSTAFEKKRMMVKKKQNTANCRMRAVLQRKKLVYITGHATESHGVRTNPTPQPVTERAQSPERLQEESPFQLKICKS